MKQNFSKAFTLIELLVVVSIMLILSLVVMTAIMDARKESRDTARATTAEQLSLGIRLYKEAEGKYPVYPNGVELGVGNPIDAQLAPFVKQIPKDPLTQGTGDEYEYWYYPNFLCNGERRDVVLVKKMEFDDNGNFDEVCGGGAVLPMETGLIPRAHAQTACSEQRNYSDRDGIPAAIKARVGNIGTGTWGVFADQASANKTCEIFGFARGTIVGTRGWSSPGDNTVVKWVGTSWVTLPAVNNNSMINNLTCTRPGASLSKNTVTQNVTGGLSESVSVSWSTGGQARIDLIYPNGMSKRQWDRNPSPSSVPASQSHITPLMPAGGYTVSVLLESTGQQCNLPLTLLPATVESVDYVDTPTTPVTPTAPNQNYTSAAYVVFIN